MGTSTHMPPAIDRAVIPAAGFGARLRPITQALPKEMLPLGRKPVLEHVMEEMRTAGIRRLLFVVSPSKESIRRYFGSGEAWDVCCDYVIQPERKGLGEAVLRAEAWTEDLPFVVAFGDCIVESGETHALDLPLSRLISTHIRTQAAATVLTERIPRKKARQYGMLAPAVPISDTPSKPFPLADIVEKPAPESAPSRMAVAARWALNRDIFGYLRRMTPGPDGEIGLTEAVRALLADGKSAWAVPLKSGESRLDIGGWETYLVAVARAAADDPECGPRVRAALKAALLRDASGGMRSEHR